MIPPSARVRRVLLVDGQIPAGFRLWRNSAGFRGTHYIVTARWVSQDRKEGMQDHERELGRIQIGDADSYTLAALLNSAVTPATPSFWMSIGQGEYDEFAGMRDQSQQAAGDAQTAATIAQSTVITYPTAEDMAAYLAWLSTLPVGTTVRASGTVYERTADPGLVGVVPGWRFFDKAAATVAEAPSSPPGTLASAKSVQEALAAQGAAPRRIAVTGANRVYAVHAADFAPAYHQVLPTANSMIMVDVSGIALDREYEIVSNGNTTTGVIVDCGASAYFRALWLSPNQTALRRFYLAPGETAVLRRIFAGQILVDRRVAPFLWTNTNGTHYFRQPNGLWTYSLVRTASLSASAEGLNTIGTRFSLDGAYSMGLTPIANAAGTNWTGEPPRMIKQGTQHGLLAHQLTLLNPNAAVWDHPIRITFTNVTDLNEAL
ncbi:hypothetical protein HOY34_13820 [Xinfangfangia sp. D13-10-4-6]|uniref:hypothetical protein n=1 Tax=Pseudogemmobacter hezensis TaxID=2737662 RepID=UPI00155330F9|nr:hypothetical protein [Pseudogemmobacter hezensis]NPD16273.1 hypothetical protein [Pseudogemmobacter hezensis]